jgi:hypothetical protein
VPSIGIVMDSLQRRSVKAGGLGRREAKKIASRAGLEVSNRFARSDDSERLMHKPYD